MSAIEDRLLTGAEVTKRCDESEVAHLEGEPSFDAKLFLGLGQERFEHALAFCIETEDSLHNMSAVDLTGAGAFDVLEGILERMLKGRTLPDPQDICYVYNFEDPHRPLPIPLPIKGGKVFQKVLTRLLVELKKAVSHELQTHSLNIQPFARRFGFSMTSQPFGQLALPLESLVREARGESPTGTETEDRSVTPEVVDRLNDAEKTHIQNKLMAFRTAFEKEERRIAKETIEQVFNTRFPPGEKQSRFRAGLLDYSVNNFGIFLKEEREQQGMMGMSPEGPDSSFLPFEVKVFVDHSETGNNTENPNRINVPIVAGRITTLASAIGSIGRGRSFGGPYGGFTVDHRNLVPGFFHVANGGYLLLRMRDVISVPGLWQVLKGVIKNQEIPVGETPLTLMGYEAPLRPEPMTAHLKVILFGPAWLMHLVSYVDDEFTRLFKIRGEILTKVERTPEQIRAYRSWFEKFTAGEGMHTLGRDGTCALIEYAQRLAGDHQHLSTDFDALTTLVQEANTLVDERAPEEEKKIQRAHVTEAIRKRVWRSNVPHERRLEHVRSGSLLVSTEGEAIGQINGLAVTQYDCISGSIEQIIEQKMEAFCRSVPAPFNLPADKAREIGRQCVDFYGASDVGIMFGCPTRITARASVGRFAIVNIEKEVKMSGPSFEKADLIVRGLLRGLYAKDAPLEVHITFAFEQSYNGIDGDSASLAGFCALTSAIAEIPIRQSIAITGSLSQYGDIQPIGGVNEKIEGFFDVCLAKGALTGHQGVIIPHQNEQNLMLREDVVQAIARHEFNVWAIRTLDEGIEILTGVAPDQFHGSVKKRLQELAKKAKKFYAPPSKHE